MPISSSVTDATLQTPYGEAAYKLVEILMDAGFDVWWVGGCVRDMLQQRIPTDIDIATDAKPEEIQALCSHAEDVGRVQGAVRVRQGKFAFEVTTFRTESAESDGRMPHAVQYTDRKDDAMRRDFTINALYYHPVSRELYDPYGGEADLRDRLVQCIGDPETRFKHDALRIFRAIRMRCAIDGQYHPNTYTALRGSAHLVASLSGMRKLQELEKLLATPNADKGLEDQWELGILETYAPELYGCKGIAQPKEYHQEGDVWSHLLCCVRAFREEDAADVRIAALLHDIGKAVTFSQEERIRFDHHAEKSAELAQNLLRRLQMAQSRIEKITWIIEHHMMMGSLVHMPGSAGAPMPDDRKAHWYYHKWFPDLLRVLYLDAAGTKPTHLESYEAIVRDYQSFLDKNPRPMPPLLHGDDVMRITKQSAGPRIGEILDAVREMQLSKKLTQKSEAEEYVRLHFGAQ